MPSVYTHLRFGRDVIKHLPEKIQRRISAHRELFDIGLMGPDIFFWYFPLVPNRVNTTGYGMHKTSPEAFLRHSKKVLSEMPLSDRSAGYAYLCGFICHYILDRNCHRYIRRQIRESGEIHSRLETALERLLLEADGIDPFSVNVASEIVPSPGNCRIISQFYNGISPEQTMRSVTGQIFFRRASAVRSPIVRSLLDLLFLFTGNFPHMHHLLMSRGKNIPAVRCRELLMIYSSGISQSAYLIANYTGYLKGKNKLKGFTASFDGNMHISR